MQGVKNIGVAVVILFIVGVGAYLLTRGGEEVIPSQLSFGSPYVGAPLKDEYRNREFNFSLQMPEGFRSQELPADENGARTVVLQNEKGEGIQIYITPYPDDLKVITADDVRAAIPDMKVSEEQAVQIGANYQGVAFKSDNEAFAGDSREVWFVFRSNLYQISTYSRLDGLLQAMFGTWKFN
jgi:hypothetical protein